LNTFTSFSESPKLCNKHTQMHLKFFTRTLKLIISKKEWNKDITVACCDICCGNGGGGDNDFGVDDDGGGDGLK